LKKYVVLGCTHHHHVADRLDYHSNEIKYDIAGRRPGIYGTHATYRFGGEYEVNAQTKFKPKLTVSDEVVLALAW